MVADRPPSQYPAFFAELLFWDSRGVTFEDKQTNKQTRSTTIIKKRSAQVICGWTHLGDDATSKKRGISLTFLSVFGIEAWDLEAADRLRLQLTRALSRVLGDISSE